MHTGFDVRTASTQQLAQQRDQLYAALPPAGQKAQGMLALWAAGVGGVTSEELDKVILDDRVQGELRQTPVDAVGLTTGGRDRLHRQRRSALRRAPQADGEADASRRAPLSSLDLLGLRTGE